MATTLNGDQVHLLQSQDHLKILDEIDRLRSQGISHYVSLPQLIVCGDQSSGKSSVLEAISGISFPSKDNLCTRFATEVILRKADAVNVSVRIVPSQARSEDEYGRLLQFSEFLDDLKKFPAIVEKAKDVMGISATTSAFSNDVLRVEISGPNRPSLTIVDLPGLIHSENKLQSSADVTMVWEMVRGYMQNQRSIILAIISAKNDYANQIVLKLAKEVDNSGYRTLGIITKPDTLSVGSESEAAFVDLAKNQDVTFRLGWHVLRNRSYESRDASGEERNATEAAFFSQGVWKALPSANIGISTLQTRLSKVLLDQIRVELPELLKDIDKGVGETTKKLKKLGEKRANVDDQRLFLLRIGQSFQALVKAALDGTYVDPFFGELGYGSDTKRLRAIIQTLNIGFAESMRLYGQRRRILDSSNARDSRQTDPNAVTRDDFEEEIVLQLQRNRGRELPGMFNPMIVGEMFHQQCQPWEGKARVHVKNICDAVETFLEQALSYLADENTSSNILRDIMGPLLSERAKEVNVKLDEILAPFTRGHPITYNHYFTETIQDIRKKRQKRDIKERLRKLSPSSFDPSKGSVGDDVELNVKVSDLVSVLSSRNEADMDKYAASEILLCMEAYYKVALKVFVDNVAAQAVEACLLAQLSEVLSPTSILKMDPSLVEAIAGEPEDSQLEREQLSRKLAVLNSGLEICKRYATRPTRKEAGKTFSDVKTKKDGQLTKFHSTVQSGFGETPSSTLPANARTFQWGSQPGLTPAPAPSFLADLPAVPVSNSFAASSNSFAPPSNSFGARSNAPSTSFFSSQSTATSLSSSPKQPEFQFSRQKLAPSLKNSSGKK